ncbi:hypothetical protein NDA16_002235 [Ustilago loliicola]|nr:hypothetical protein NDA16_002235 [Ustilago loliicola]
MTYASSGSSSSGGTFSAGPSSSTSRSPSAEPSASIPTSSTSRKTRRLTLEDIHIPAGFELAKSLGSTTSSTYPSEENIQKAAEVLQSLRGRMPDGSDGQVAACDYCRRRKIRCDRTKPTCGSCVASGRKCTTEDMLRKRGPPSKKERAILEAAGIIFRGTRPHHRCRTATTSLGSGAASKQQEEMLRKVKEAAGTRTRSNSTNDGAVAGMMVEGGFEGSKSSWMEILSIATQATNLFADSPASSPSDISVADTFQIDAGACDYILPNTDAPLLTKSVSGDESGVQWDNMWATFGADLRNKHSANDVSAAYAAGLALPNLTAFACNNGMDTKEGLLRSSPMASFDAGALDWSASHLSPSQYQMLFPSSAPQVPGHNDATAIPVAHVDPQMMAPHQQEIAQPSAPQPFISSQSSMAAEAIAFQTAMGHFFPKNHPLSSSSSSSGATAEASTPTELDQFISLSGDQFSPNHLQPHQHQQQAQQLPFSMAF